jgi:glutaredoxin
MKEGRTNVEYNERDLNDKKRKERRNVVKEREVELERVDWPDIVVNTQTKVYLAHKGRRNYLNV